MINFKFVKENGFYKWESSFMVLQFSFPSIQAFTNFLPIKSEKDIMYYYYSIEIFKKVIEYDENLNEIERLELVSERNSHDFPTIIQLKSILNHQLKDDTRINGQKIEYSDHHIRYSKTLSTGGFACDDFFEITKNVDENNANEKYTVYCGTSFDNNGDLNSSGIRTPYVDKEDLTELLKCVTSFIKYSIKQYNQSILLFKDKFEINNNKIYEYKEKEDSIDRNSIESIYSIGDSLDVTIIKNNQEIEYNDITINKIENNRIYLGENIVIDINTIAYISNNPTQEMLKYNQDEIKAEFLSILSENERKEFKIHDINYLSQKYESAILNRTWMCREEHNFNINYHNGNRVDLVTPIIKAIIIEIQQELKSN